jgi:hypothetical protein
MQEARDLGLFQPHSAVEVHCLHCGARLNPHGDCSSCGLIGQPESFIERRAATDPESVSLLLRGAIEKRKRYTPPERKGAKSAER